MDSILVDADLDALIERIEIAAPIELQDFVPEDWRLVLAAAISVAFGLLVCGLGARLRPLRG